MLIGSSNDIKKQASLLIIGFCYNCIVMPLLILQYEYSVKVHFNPGNGSLKKIWTQHSLTNFHTHLILYLFLVLEIDLLSSCDLKV